MLRIAGTAVLAAFGGGMTSWLVARALGLNAGIAAVVSGVLLAFFVSALLVAERRRQRAAGAAGDAGDATISPPSA